MRRQCLRIFCRLIKHYNYNEMKKKGITRTVMIVMFIVTLFNSCTKENDEKISEQPSVKTEYDLINEIEGRYIGDIDNFPANLVVKKQSNSLYSLYLVCDELNINVEINDNSLSIHNDENGLRASIGKYDFSKQGESVNYWYVSTSRFDYYSNGILNCDIHFFVTDYGERVGSYWFDGDKI